MFTIALFVTAKDGNNHMSINWWMNNNVVYVIAHYLAIKRNEVPTHATTRMNFWNITLAKKKPVTEDYVLRNSIYMRCLEDVNLETEK